MNIKSNDINNMVSGIGKTDMKKYFDLVLVNNHAKYHNIFSAVKDSLFLIEPKSGCILDANYAACHLYGYSLEEMLELTDVDICEDLSKHIRMSNTTQPKEPFCYHKKKDGSVFPAEITTNMVTLNERNVILLSVRDITGEIENKRMMEKMVVFSEELLQVSTQKVEFQKILENLLYISKAKYGILNLYNEAGDKFTTVALAGINGSVEKVSKLFGFEIIGKEWDDDVERNKKTSGKIITHFSSINELAGEVVNSFIIRTIEKVFKLGDVFVVKIIKDDKMIGDFTLIMAKGMEFQNDNLVEIYSRQIGMFITRKTTERAIEKRDKMLNAISEATKLLLINSNYSDAIPKGLALLGKAVGVDRVAYFQISFDNSENKRIAVQKAEWVSDCEKQTSDTQDMSFEVFDEYIPELLRGKPFEIAVNNLHNSHLKTMLIGKRLLSILVLPIFVKGSFWGVVGFGDNDASRKWVDTEISTLHIFIDSISKSIERKLYEEELEFLSYHDNLTGLYNRRKFLDLCSIIDASGKLPVSVIAGDVNGLKLVNDAFGHISGDNLLKKISQIMKHECGEGSYVARRGGDEFAVLLPGCTYNDACLIISRIKKCCEKETTDELMLNISFGVETKTSDVVSLEQCYSVAEDRMYGSKLLEGKSIRNKIIENFRTVMEEKTGETKKHCERMAELSRKIGDEVGMLGYEIENLKLLALLHDIGKTGVPDNILLKPDRLNEQEMTIMKKHCEIGFRIANTLHELLPIADGILNHHERWDGTGYPRGLKGEEIPFMARIVSILDTYDAMTNDRPYRKALSVQEAIIEIKLCSGAQFDPYIVDVFINKVLKNIDREI